MCGIVGMVAFDPSFNDTASHLSWALVELEHRGKETSGIITNKGMHIGVGQPEQVFNEQLLSHLGGSIGLGHVLYTTSGKSFEGDKEALLKRSQPTVADLGGDRNKRVGFSFNGNLVNWQELRDECMRRGYQKEIINDTGVIAALLEMAHGTTLKRALKEEVLPRIKWSFCIIFYAVYERKLYAVRDPRGFMPLVYGRRDNEWLIVASEDCVFAKGAFDCTRIDEVPPGHIVTLDPARTTPLVESWVLQKVARRKCIFHFIYFDRPDSTLCGRSVKVVQEKSGELLAKQHPVDHADVILPVRDSGFVAAQGYAKAMTKKTGRWLFDCFGLFRPHTVGRTFMEPHPHLRKKGVGKKLRVIPESVKDQVVTIIDDSLVRGETLKTIVRRLFDAGAKEVHVRIASPPNKEPCVYGIDTPTYEELAWNHCGKSIEGIRAFIGATSLEFLDDIRHNIQAVLETTPRYPHSLDKNSFCTQCFTGESAVSS